MTAVHDHDLLTVDDLTFTVAAASDRTTLEVVVDRDGTLELKAPRGTGVADVEAFVRRRRSWIYRRLAEKHLLAGPPVHKHLVDGEGFAYLGRTHRLRIDDLATEVSLDHGRLRVPAASDDVMSSAIVGWYRAVGVRWLRLRAARWEARLGLAAVDIVVLDLGWRWGSCRTGRELPRINVHWAALQLPPSLIDYVLVHEFVHLEQQTHDRRFWDAVGRVLPHHAELRGRLAAAGRHLWLGDVQQGPADQ